MNFWEFLSDNILWIFIILALCLGGYYNHIENMAKIQHDAQKAEAPLVPAK